MEPACLRHTELPHTSRLFSDFLYHYHRVERFYTAPPSTGYPEERRPEMIAALRAQNGDHPSLEILSRPGAVTVVTGQQVGLFSGPAYTIYKALTAAKLAEELSARGTPAVPVFWLATEDHDFAEVNHAWGFDHSNRPIRFEVDGNSGNNRPVGGIEIDHWPVEEFARRWQACRSAMRCHPWWRILIARAPLWGKRFTDWSSGSCGRMDSCSLIRCTRRHANSQPRCCAALSLSGPI